MTRTMYDGITPATVPAGAALYAGYVGGHWPSYAALAAAHPSALHVSIAVNASESARCLDVENGDASPQQAPGWVLEQRAAGNPDPWVYMNYSTWAAVQAAFAAQRVPPPLYWVALYVTDPANVPDIPDGAIGIQYYDFGGYDASIMADHIPGLDPAPAPAAPAAPVPEQEIDMLLVSNPQGIWLLSGAMYVPIDNTAALESLKAAGVKSVAVDATEHARFIAASTTPKTAA